MSEYQNYIQDFPNRCCEILENFGEEAKEKNLAVTLMLSIATAGFSIPYERLKNKRHPSQDSSSF